MALGIISGTGLYDLALSEDSRKMTVSTPYGEAILYAAAAAGEELFFLPRHGTAHSLPPHAINYRANICALAMAGVKEVLAFCSVGSMLPALAPGSLVLLEQFIDMSWGRAHTFAEADALGHVEMSEPYCPRLSRHLLALGEKAGIPLQRGGVYLCTQGPRFETPAEIRAYASWGANVVGMTGVPEVSLAREAGLCYASVAVVGNYAAGLVKEVDVGEISGATHQQQGALLRLLEAYLGEQPPKAACPCPQAKIPPCRKWQGLPNL